jgi:hypothetical protein
MTATSPVSPGRSASPDSSGLRRNPQDSRAPATGPFAPRIATPTGVTEVHHG